MDRSSRHGKAAATAAALALVWAAGPLRGAQTELIGGETPWRVFLTCAPPVVGTAAEPKPWRRGKQQAPTPLPPEAWRTVELADGAWGRFAGGLDDALGGYGYFQPPQWALLCLRTRFGIAAPPDAGGLKLTVEYRGGAVVHVNGTEVARGHMPEGPIAPLTLAEDYPVEAYMLPDGENPLPRSQRPAEENRDRYEKRIRRLTAIIPRAVLRKGANVLAIELHRAALRTTRWEWSTVGLCGARLTSETGAGVIPFAEAARGVQLWNALPLETVARKPEPLKRSWGTGPESLGPAGLRRANPFDPLRPVRMLAARGGVCSGQVVLTCPSPPKDLTASVGPLSGAGGAAIPAGAVRIRYAVQADGGRYCDALSPMPDPNSAVQPVWVIVEVPRDQPPGWYAGTLTVRADGKAYRAALHVFVSAWTLPPPREYRSFVSLVHSPDTLALQYRAEPLSEAHWRLLAGTMELLGQVGNDVLFVPIVHKTHMGHETGFIRWVARGGAYEPDYGALERLMDLYAGHCGPPKVICLIVWKPQYGSKASFRGAQVKTREPIVVTRLDPKTGGMSPMEAPMFGADGSEGFWKTMFDGVRAIVRKRGWDENTLLLGQGFDSRPLRETVDFFHKVAPGMRWNVFSHWVRDSRPEDGKLVLSNGMVVGYREQAAGAPLPVLHPDWPNHPRYDFLAAGSHRMDVVEWSPPTSWRNVANMTGTFCRNGLDFWPVVERDGRRRKIFNSGICGAWLYRGNPVSFVAPGPKGTLSTVRFQMFREGIQETEARIFLAERLGSLPEERQRRCRELLAEREVARSVGRALTQAQISLDWLALTAREYAAAAELAGARPDATWTSPPPADLAGK